MMGLFLVTLVAVPTVDQAHAYRRNAQRAAEAASLSDAPVPSQGALVEATISAIAAPPKPGTVPYKDCLIAMHLVDVKNLKGIKMEPAILVFAWGLQDARWTPNATLKAGTRVTLHLQPWSDVETQLGAVNRIELTDDELLLMSPWWASSILPTKAASARSRNLLSLIPFNLPRVKTLRNIEAALEEGSIVREYLIPIARSALHVTLGQGSEQTEIRGEWLYLRQDIDHLTGPGFLEPSWQERRQRSSKSWEEPPQSNPVPALVNFRDQLAARGIQMLVLPVPVKPSIHPEPYSGHVMALPVRNPSFQRFVDMLAAEQIEMFDPAETLIAVREQHGSAYLKTDTHWTPAAMEAVAKGLSERLHELGWMQRTETQGVVGSRAITGAGDLLENLGLPEKHRTPLKEQVEVHPVAGPPPPNGEARILLLGDSFSNIYSQAGLGWGTDAGLPQHLAHSLGTHVDWIAQNAGGASAARRSVDGHDLAGKTVVVLQFAERELSFGDWQLVTLPSAQEGEDIEAQHALQAPDLGKFKENLRKQIGEAGGQQAIRGDDNFLFFVPELRHLAAGTFWGEAAQSVGRAPDPTHRDPLPAILDFHAQLKKAGVRLIFVPVPPKAVVYADHLGPVPMTERVDPEHLVFYTHLREKGIEVIDLVPAFQKARANGCPPLYCRTDTHWSGAAIELTADLIVKALGDAPSAPSVTALALQLERRTTDIQGDLLDMVSPPRPETETLPLAFVTDRGNPVETWRDSPVLLLGDSHNLIFHAGGDMHHSGAGLPDHLARQLGYPVDLLAVRGSGATPSRISLLRRRDNLKGKRVVIWVLAAREFTEGQGWRKIPVIR